MAITTDDFNKIWASTSPLTPYSFSASQYKEGWNFIGSTPPSRQMWDFLQKNNDEKLQYLANNYLPLSGGTLTGDVLGVTPPNGDNSKKLANTEFIQALASILVPVGCVQAYAGSSTPSGWLFCDGSAVSRITYADLFAVIGTTYGAGDGTNTFNLPNLIDKFVEGSATAGTVKSAGLPNIKGFISFRTVAGPENNLILGEDDIFPPTGPFYKTTKSWSGSHSALYESTYSPYAVEQLNMDASRSNSVYGNSNTVQPPSLTMRYIIKY